MFHEERPVRHSLGEGAGGRLRTLFTVLGDLAASNPKLVLMKGDHYYRIEDMISIGRRLLSRSSPDTEIVHRRPRFYADRDWKGKVVIWEEAPDGERRRAIYSEPGSSIRAED